MPGRKRSPTQVRKNYAEEDDDTSPSSDSELSDLSVEEESDEISESSSEDEDAEGEVEDSYVFEEEKDDDEILSKRKGTKEAAPTARKPPKAPSKRGGRGGNRGARGGTAQRKKVGSTATAQRSSIATRRRSSITTAPRGRGKGRGTAGSYKPESQEPTLPTTATAAAATDKKAPTIRLKIAATPESVAPPPPPPPKSSGNVIPRGRKVIEEDSDEDEDEDAEGSEEDEEQSKMDEEEPEDQVGVDPMEVDEELIDEDAEGETDDEMLDSDDETNDNTPGTDFLSRTATPDMSRLTNRQRSRLGQVTTADHLELPDQNLSKEVPLSAAEQELKRAETARRRKTLTDQRLQEEKMDTINKLLKKQTPKMRRGRVTGDATPASKEDGDGLQGLDAVPLPPPNMTRWISSKAGVTLSIPGTWLASPAGAVFEPQKPSERMRKLVEEVG